jgi:hypothetical protein
MILITKWICLTAVAPVCAKASHAVPVSPDLNPNETRKHRYGKPERKIPVPAPVLE